MIDLLIWQIDCQETTFKSCDRNEIALLLKNPIRSKKGGADFVVALVGVCD